jgi:hypothetical protein
MAFTHGIYHSKKKITIRFLMPPHVHRLRGPPPGCGPCVTDF